MLSDAFTVNDVAAAMKTDSNVRKLLNIGNKVVDWMSDRGWLHLSCRVDGQDIAILIKVDGIKTYLTVDAGFFSGLNMVVMESVICHYKVIGAA